MTLAILMWLTMLVSALLGLTLLPTIVLLGPLSEEVGRHGFAQDRFGSTLRHVRGTLLLGLVWWAWHLRLFWMPSTLHGSQGLFSAFAIGYLFSVHGYSVVFAWIHHRTNRSILAAVAAHFSINVTFAAATPFDGSIIAVATVLLAIGATALAWRDPSLGAAPSPRSQRST